MKLKEYKAKIEEYEATMARQQEELKNQIVETLSELIKETPELKAIKIIGYTPYFNDGDECVYSAEPYMLFDNTEGTDKGDYEDGFVSKYEFSSYQDDPGNPRYEEIAQSVGSFLDAVPNEIYQAAFGDHTKSIITENSVTTEGYDHE